MTESGQSELEDRFVLATLNCRPLLGYTLFLSICEYEEMHLTRGFDWQGQILREIGARGLSGNISGGIEDNIDYARFGNI